MAKFRAWAGSERLGALLLAVALLVALGAAPVEALRYERAAIAAGAWWRLLTCHLAHHDARHLALNLAGLALLWGLYAGAARPRDWGIVALAAALTIGLGLYFLAPEVRWYLGLSGVLHGGWAAAPVFLWRRARAEALASGALLALKLALEAWSGPLTTALDPSLPVIVAAHRLGALGGLAAALALGVRRAPL